MLPLVIFVMVISFIVVAYHLGLFKDLSKITTPSINHFKSNGLKSKIFTYIENDTLEPPRYSLPHFNYFNEVPAFYNYCIQTAANTNDNLVVVTPENINDYVKLPFVNGPESLIPLKVRSDYIGAALLNAHGGIYLSPGTIVLKNLNEITKRLDKYDLVTFGLARDPPGPSCCDVDGIPNNYVIASRPNNPVLTIYMNNLNSYCKNGTYSGGNFANTGTDALKKALDSYKKNIKSSYRHYNYGANYDGTRDIDNRFVDFNVLLGKMPIEYETPSKLFFISTPYEHLTLYPEYSWILNLSDQQLMESDMFLFKN